jgi:hypothetical protein
MYLLLFLLLLAITALATWTDFCCCCRLLSQNTILTASSLCFYMQLNRSARASLATRRTTTPEQLGTHLGSSSPWRPASLLFLGFLACGLDSEVPS